METRSPQLLDGLNAAETMLNGPLSRSTAPEAMLHAQPPAPHNRFLPAWAAETSPPPQDGAEASSRPHANVASRLHQGTVSTLAKRRAPGQPGGATNLLTIPALPPQPAMAPLSTYYVAPSDVAAAAPRRAVPVASVLSPGLSSDAIHAAYGAAEAAASALGLAAWAARPSASMAARGEVRYTGVLGEGPEPVGMPGGGAAAGEMYPGAVHGGAGEMYSEAVHGGAGGDLAPGSLVNGGPQASKKTTVRFDLARPSEVGEPRSTSDSATYIKLPQPRRYCLSQMR